VSAKPSSRVPDKEYVYVGKTEIKALIVGLVTGALYGALNLPIPAPNVLGGNLAILFTFIGLLTIGLLRREMALGRPPKVEQTPDQRPGKGRNS